MNRDRKREIMRRLDPETWIALASDYVPGLRERGSGGDWWGRCPCAHDLKGETLHVRADRRWKCFAPGCGGGGPVQLLKQTRGISEEEALALIATRVGLDG